MSEYRDEMLEKVEAKGAETFSIDVYAGAREPRSLGELDVQQQADANLAMAEVFRSENDRVVWSGLDAENITDSQYVKNFGEHFGPDGLAVDIPMHDGDGEVNNVPFSKANLDYYFDRYASKGGSPEVVERAKGTQAYQLAAEAETDWLARQQAEDSPTPSPSPEQPNPQSGVDLSALEAAVAQNRIDAGVDDRRHETSTERARSRRAAILQRMDSTADADFDAVRKAKSGRGSPLASLNLDGPPPLDAGNRPEPGAKVSNVDNDNAGTFTEATDRFGNSVADALDGAARALIQHAERIARIEQELAEARR